MTQAEDAGEQDIRAMTVRLPAALHDRLRRAAFERRVPMGAIVIAGTGRELDRLESEDGHE